LSKILFKRKNKNKPENHGKINNLEELIRQKEQGKGIYWN